MFSYDRFEQARRACGVTKKFIADSLGRSPAICQDWKQGKSQPSARQLSCVASILGVSPAYLLCETDEPLPPDDEELDSLLAALREREDMRMLFKLAKDATPQDVRQAVRIIEALRRDD